MSRISVEDFEKLADGRPVELYTIRNTKGTEVKICTYGGHVQALRTRDRDGKLIDIVLGYDDIATYEKEDKYIGALIGRCGNRIARGHIQVAGRDYQLECNDGRNHLHGGSQTGFNKKLWAPMVTQEGLCLSYTSPAGEGGYPGELRVAVWYSLSNDNEFSIRYEAKSDADTVCNLTNHTYFNLDGYAGGPVLDQKIQLFADAWTEADEESLPNGRIVPVAGTPMDLREPTAIGAHIDDDFDQLRWAGGYDHNWVIRDVPCDYTALPGSFGYDPGCPIDYIHGGLKKMAYAVSDRTGITLTAYTTQPGVQFYAGNYLDGSPLGKNGTAFERRSGFCLEAQYFPNALEHPEFRQPLLKKGEVWKAQTVYVIGNQGKA